MATASIRVLIADDDSDFRDLLAAEFEMAGCHVLHAENASTAISALHEQPVEVVISDFLMPTADAKGDESGLALLDAVNAMHQQKPTRPVVVMLTGFGDLLPREAYDKGATAIFAKPVDRSALVRFVFEKLGMPMQRL